MMVRTPNSSDGGAAAAGDVFGDIAGTGASMTAGYL